MAIDPAAGAAAAGYLVVTDYVLAVSGDLVLLAAPRQSLADAWYILLVNQSELSM